jgi:hypothetical protein
MRSFVLLLPLLLATSALADTSWERALADEVSAIRTQRPDAVRALDELRGLDPDYYLKQRRPEPEVARELKQLLQNKAVPAALMIDRALTLLEERAAPADRAKTEERAQLRDGLYRVIGISEHAAADDLLARAALQPDARARRVAIESLGWTRTPLATETLLRIAREPASTDGDRASALIGLGAAGQTAVLVELSQTTKVAGDADARRAVVGALAMQRGARDAAAALVVMLSRETDATLVTNLVEALSRVGHEDTRALLGARTFATAEAEAGAARVLRRIERRRARGL